MSTIDKIMGAIGRHGDDCIRDGDAASESFDALREMITAALKDARRDGAEAMREAAASVCAQGAILMTTRDQTRGALRCEQAVRALPLPAGERQAVLLTDELLDALADEVFDLIQDAPDDAVEDRTWDRMFGRSVQSAVLAENGLEVTR